MCFVHVCDGWLVAAHTAQARGSESRRRLDPWSVPVSVGVTMVLIA